MDPTLIFVYNADSGLLNGLRDLLHKLVSPQSYNCQLCGLSYSALGMRREWKQFVASLAHPVLFLHADELRQRYGVAEVPLPAVFIKKGSAPEPWLFSITEREQYPRHLSTLCVYLAQFPGEIEQEATRNNPSRGPLP